MTPKPRPYRTREPGRAVGNAVGFVTAHDTQQLEENSPAQGPHIAACSTPQPHRPMMLGDDREVWISGAQSAEQFAHERRIGERAAPTIQARRV